MKKYLILCLWLLFGAIYRPTNARAEIVNFSIGNSLTNQLHNAFRMQSISAIEGSNAIQSNYHVWCNHNLTNIVANPTTTCVPAVDFGYYGEAFASHKFDTVTLQPFLFSTIREEVDSAVHIVNQLRQNPANANTRVLIYGTWGVNTEDNPFVESWKRQDLTLDSLFIPSKKGYELFMQEFLISVPNAEFIPAGHVVAAIAERMNTPDQVPGFSNIKDLIGDTIHATDAGVLVASLSMYSTIYGKSTVGYDYLSGFLPFDPNDKRRLTPTALRQIQQIAWDVENSLSFSPRSSSQAPSAPLNFDSSFTSVPEPSSVGLVGLVMCSLLTSFRRRPRNA